MTPEQASRLRAEFPPEHVGLLPRITCPKCSQANGRCCQEHKKAKCNACGNYITERHMHIDYVGHGAVTDRLIEVDPEWNWEPLAYDQTSGMPTMIYDAKGNPVSFWIKLTLGGVTRLGVGSCPSGQDDAEKVLIGDALRNAAMRFGVALDLWIKGHAEDDERATQGRSAGRGRTTAQPSKPTILQAWAKRQLLDAADGDKDAAAAAWEKAGLSDEPKVTEAQLEHAFTELEQLAWSWHRPAGDEDQVPGGAVDREATDIPQEPAAAGRASVDTPPGTTNGQAPRSRRDIAQRAGNVFRAAYDAAPRGDKTRTVDRLRHALTWAATGKQHSSTKDCDAAQLAAVWARLDDIQAGRLAWEHDDTGVTFSSQSGKPTRVDWSDFDPTAKEPVS